MYLKSWHPLKTLNTKIFISLYYIFTILLSRYCGKCKQVYTGVNNMAWERFPLRLAAQITCQSTKIREKQYIWYILLSDSSVKGFMHELLSNHTSLWAAVHELECLMSGMWPVESHWGNGVPSEEKTKAVANYPMGAVGERKPKAPQRFTLKGWEAVDQRWNLGNSD